MGNCRNVSVKYKDSVAEDIEASFYGNENMILLKTYIYQQRDPSKSYTLDLTLMCLSRNQAGVEKYSKVTFH